MRQALVNLICRLWPIMPRGAKTWAFLNDSIPEGCGHPIDINDWVYRLCERIAALFNKKPQS